MLNIVRISFFCRPIPSIESIGKIINKELESLPKGLEIVSEPGYIVSDSAVLVVVICSTIRSGERWVHRFRVFGGCWKVTGIVLVFSQNEGKVPYLAGPHAILMISMFIYLKP